MRLLALAGAVLSVSAVLALPAAGANGTGEKPRLVLARTSPLLLHGMSFEPRERVRVSVLGVRWTKIVRANASGRFAFRLAGAPAAVCGKRWLRAVGARGSVAARSLWLGVCAPDKPLDRCASPIVRDPTVDRRPCIPPPGAKRDP
jgi:hypothetical protein